MRKLGFPTSDEEGEARCAEYMKEEYQKTREAIKRVLDAIAEE